MFKKCFHSLIYNMGLLALGCIILSLIFPNEFEFWIFQLSACVAIPGHIFSFFTFQLKLCSNRLWVRRIIVISFGSFVMIAVSYLFGYPFFRFRSLLGFGIAIFLYVILTGFGYYVCDKIEEQNLKLINQKLGEKKAGNDNIN